MLTPNKSSTLTITANAVPQNAALPVGGGLCVSLFNRGANDCFVEFSGDANSTVSIPTATVQGGLPILANAPAQVIQLPPDATRIAHISAGNSTLYVTRGQSVGIS